uniref:Uncharacterized protein n=1 Tax=Tetraselmis sp. GSL018 TaxID=582737 RepID=A0A061SB97_9CHLO|mmetsp:Transcript_38891/g.92129  ORF Transcript_38891/g.92129 Transcript_38891/m.92129 type:complete len:233 (+) Transcript_38891:264-962(+)
MALVGENETFSSHRAFPVSRNSFDTRQVHSFGYSRNDLRDDQWVHVVDAFGEISFEEVKMPVEAAMACSWSSPEPESDGEDANNIMQQTDLLLKAVHQLANERSMQELTVRHPTFHDMIGFTRQPESSSAGSAPQIPSTASFSFVHRAADGRRRLPQKICSMFRAGLRSLGKAGGCALGSVSRVVRGEPFDGPRLKGETVALEEAWDHQICGAVFGLVCLVLATVFLQRVRR